MITILAFAFYKGCENLHTELHLRFLHKIVRASYDFTIYNAAYWLCGRQDLGLSLDKAQKFFNHVLGKVKKKVLPIPGSLSTHSLPSCASTMPLAMARPRPNLPDSLVSECPLPV